jgi:small nuclear ribonucleoprotein G
VGPDLKRYMDKKLALKLNGSRHITGKLRGFDQFMNLVLDETVEHVSATERNDIGMVCDKPSRARARTHTHSSAQNPLTERVRAPGVSPLWVSPTVGTRTAPCSLLLGDFRSGTGAASETVGVGGWVPWLDSSLPHVLGGLSLPRVSAWVCFTHLPLSI